MGYVGWNGAGRMTGLSGKSGLATLASETIKLRDRRIDLLSPGIVAMQGANMLEGRYVFGKLAVMNDQLLNGKQQAPQENRRHVGLGSWCMVPMLKDSQSQKAQTQSGGEQQMLGRELKKREAVHPLEQKMHQTLKIAE
jgi:ABC-type branched-subunit amino acid transport system ATPase component